MKFRKPTKYALIAVGYIAQHQKEGLVNTLTLSEEHMIPYDFLEKILSRLDKAGILLSKRGRGGGYVLRKKLDEITLLEIIEATEGSALKKLAVFKELRDMPLIRNMKEVCEKAIVEHNKILQTATLADIFEGEKK